jgi:uncharacterized protein
LDFTYRELFVLVKILVWLVTVGLQFSLFKLMVKAVENYFPFSFALGKVTVRAGHLLAALLIFLNIPGVYVAFAGGLGLPLWLNKITVYPYVLWQISSVVLLSVILIRMLVRSIRGSKKTATSVEQSEKDNPVNNEPQAVFNPSRRALLKTGFVAAPVYLLGASSLGAFEPENYEIVRKTVSMPGLPAKLEGLQVALVSDIHAGPYMDKAQMDGYVRVVNGLKPDIILLPGDFVNNKTEEIEPLCEAFQHLRADYGVYGCLGNHDYFDDEDKISNEIRLCGVDLLRDANTIIHPRGEAFSVIGVEDIHPTEEFDPHFKKAVTGLKRKTPHILMCHKPYYLENAAQWGVNLVVSGHTHGGQIVFARIFDTVLSPATLISEYIEGLYSIDATQMYVTRGIGMVGVPVRWNCPPEVTLLTLKSA